MNSRRGSPCGDALATDGHHHIKWVQGDTTAYALRFNPAMVPDLPMDVWLQILQVIPEHELNRLLSLNSLFFHTVMKNRYRDIRISNSPKEAKRSVALLRRLSYVIEILEPIYYRDVFYVVTHLLVILSKPSAFASNSCPPQLVPALPASLGKSN